jgi:hypothetical protein
MADEPKPALKLTAFDAEDLQVVSAEMQDATVLVGDITYLPTQKKLALVANRFCWESAASPDAAGSDERGDGAGHYRRCRCGLHFNRVFSVKYANVRRDNPDGVLSLLAILFHPDEDPPGGVIELTFSGGGVLRAEVECIEAALDDLGLSWETPRKPAHAAAADEPDLGSATVSKD